LKQFILKNDPDKNGMILLEGDDYRYLVRVRRLAAGEFFPALLPNGKETVLQIISISGNTLACKSCNYSEFQRDEVSGTYNKPRKNEAINTTESVCEDDGRPVLPPIILFQALPKGDKMDLIVRQAAESGITEIVPFVSEFSVAKTKGDGQKFSRWERIIKEARQQSGSKTATSLHTPLTLNLLFDYWKNLIKNESNSLGLLFHHIKINLEDEQTSFAQTRFANFDYENSISSELYQKVLDKNPFEFYHKQSTVRQQCSLHNYLDSDPKIISAAIGPEGGFSDAEISLFLENGFKPLTIGDTILRTETAALYCTAAVRTILLERDKWELNKRQTM